MRLFKYLHSDRTDVLRNATIRFTSPRVLNDPFELKPHFAAFGPPGWLLEGAKRRMPEQVATMYEEKVPAHLRDARAIPLLQALTMASLPQAAVVMEEEIKTMFLPQFQTHVYQAFEEMLGILCLTESPASLLMWAHYADAHRGFVVEFDSDSPFFNQRLGPEDEFRHLRKVTYQDERPALVLMDIQDFSPFLAKGKDWAYETEWRMILPLEKASRVIGEGPTAVHLFDFPTSAIRGLILGCRMPEPRRTEIRDILKAPEYNHVRCRDARVDETRYRIVFDEPQSEA